MIAPKRSNVLYDSIAVAVGAFFFSLFLLVCFRRELGPTTGFAGLFITVMFWGAVAAGSGVALMSTRQPQEKRLAQILIAEGLLLIVLVAIAWIAMGPTTIPPLE